MGGGLGASSHTDGPLMPYIKTVNSTRDYAGYRFEPMRVAGSWIGVAEVGKEQAKALIERHPQITKISKAEFEGIKKKEPANGPTFRSNPPPATASSLPPPQPSVDVVANRSEENAEDLITLGDYDG